MRGLTLVVLAVLAAGALFATNPDRSTIEAGIESKLTDQIASLDPNEAGDEVTALLLATCQAGGAGCARIIRALMQVQIENRMFYSAITLRLGQGDPARCYGLANTVFCPGV